MSEVVLAVVDPRAFSYLRERLRGLGIGFSVPRELPVECTRGRILLTDHPSKVARGEGCRVVRVGEDRESWEAALAELLAGLAGREVLKEIVIGVDTGQRTHAMVVLGDGMVLYQAKLGEEELLEAIEGMLKTPHQRLRIRIGAIPANMDRAVELAWRITQRTGAPVELADEEGTTRVRGKTSRKAPRDSDLRAAYLIATRSSTIASIGKG